MGNQVITRAGGVFDYDLKVKDGLYSVTVLRDRVACGTLEKRTTRQVKVVLIGSCISDTMANTQIHRISLYTSAEKAADKTTNAPREFKFTVLCPQGDTFQRNNKFNRTQFIGRNLRDLFSVQK